MKTGYKLFLILIDDDNYGDGENLLVNDDDARVQPNKLAGGALGCSEIICQL